MKTFFSSSQASALRLSPAWPYFVALCATAATALVRHELGAVLGPAFPLLPFVAAVAVSAWFGGIEAGLVATAASALASIFFFIEPALSLRAGHGYDAVVLGVFVLAGVLLSSGVASLRASRARLLAGTERLELEVGERRRAEADARRQRDWLSATLNSIGEAVIVTDSQGRVATMNAVAEALTGYTVSQARERPLGEIYYRVDEQSGAHLPDPLCQPLGASRAGSRSGAGDVATVPLLVSRDGSVRPIEESAAPVLDEGQPSGAVIVCRDISARHRAEEQLRRSEKRLADFFENVDVALNLVAADGTILRANQSMLDLFACQVCEFIGRDFSGFFLDREAARRLFAGLQEGRPIRAWEAQVRGVHGMVRTVLLDANSHWEGPRFEYSRCVLRDITERKRAESEAARLLESLRSADRKKDEFLAMLAHELRSPLAPISASLEILQHEPDARTAQQARAVIGRQLAQMVRLVDDLLQMSRITHNRLELRREHVRLAEVIEHAVEASRPLIDARCHAFELELPNQLLMIDADPARLAQVFANLLHNAAKFTKPGGRISLRVRRHGAEALITVSDNGVGVPADMIDHIFETFTRFESSDDVVAGGLGLGLSLVQRLTQLHGGRVEAASEGLGRGTRFTVHLPLISAREGEAPLRLGVSAVIGQGGCRQGAAVPADALPSANGAQDQVMADNRDAARPIRILVVDDAEDAAEAMATMLQILGHETRTAADGAAALEAIESFQPELVLLDIGLPRLNGYEVAQRARRRPWGSQAMLVAVTGYGQQNDIRLACEAGFDHHLTKPASLESIERFIEQVRKGRPATR